uniref:Histamine H2 receptor n=1 Tax=Cyprinodon variegatus TaxID=28743 RepID=A0A3Q2CNW3_CYPVA
MEVENMVHSNSMSPASNGIWQKISQNKAPEIMLSKVMLGVILSLLILLTVGGNVLVCLAVCASRRLRCLTNCFIVSLAVTDLLLGLLVLPFSALLQLSSEWPLGPVFCNFYISMDVMLCTASILTLLAISVDRYMAVTMPLRYASLVLPWRVAVALVSVWTVSVAVSFLPIQMGWNTVNGTVQNHGPWASKGKCRFELNRPYVLTDSLLTFYLPLLAMCWTYLKILQIARAQAKLTAVALKDHKATLTLAAVIGAFVVCWLPYFILFTVLGLKEHTDPAIVPEFSIVLWLGYANSALNPVIYGALNRDFRSAYAQLLRCRFSTYSGWKSQQSSPTFTCVILSRCPKTLNRSSSYSSSCLLMVPHPISKGDKLVSMVTILIDCSAMAHTVSQISDLYE